MKILLTGGKGMLGRSLERHLLAKRHEVIVTDRKTMDITDVKTTDLVLGRERPDSVIHCAAMTAVDICESEQDTSWKINTLGAQNVAASCGRYNIRCIAISTDYVFSGDGQFPYHEWDHPAPKTVYGLTKWHGEEAVRRHCPNHLIVRIAWLYGFGGPSFFHTLCKLGAQNGEPIKVVDDQLGNPTSADIVAESILRLLDCPLSGTIHLTCEGEASWFEFAKYIFTQKKLLREIIPCSSAAFPRPASRPSNSRLEKRVIRLIGLPMMPHWQETLQHFIALHPNG